MVAKSGPTPPAGDPPANDPPADKPVTHGEVKGLLSEALTDFFGDDPAGGTTPPAGEPTTAKGIEDRAAELLEAAVGKLHPRTTPAESKPAPGTPVIDPKDEKTPQQGGKVQRALSGFFGWSSQ